MFLNNICQHLRRDRVIIGKDTRCTGKIVGTGTVRVEGNFSGEIITAGKIILGKKAIVNDAKLLGTKLVKKTG